MEKPNGHALTLAQALQGVIHDTVKPMIDSLDEKLSGSMDSLNRRMSTMNSRMNTLEKHMDEVRSDIQKQLETTNQNVRAQLAQHRLDITADFKKALGEAKP